MQDDDQPIFVVEQVPVEDLSSWESSQDEDLLYSNPNQTLKPSPGMMDLSKFLTPSDDENEEKLYDTVENVRQQVERIKDNPKILPDTTIDSEPESWDDDDSPPLPDDEGDHQHRPQVHRSDTSPSEQQPRTTPPRTSPSRSTPPRTTPPWTTPPRTTPPRTTSPPLTSSAKEESVGPEAVESLAENLFPRKSPALIEQPSSLDLKDSANTSSSKRRGSRKSRSLRSTHLAMMSRPLVTSIIPVDPDHPMLDKSSASESSSPGELSLIGISINLLTYLA